MDEMMQAISKYPNGTYLKVEWRHGLLVIEGKIDTIYETNNGLDEEDSGYKEYYACALRIEKILNNSTNKKCIVNNLLEISIEEQPTTILLKDGSILWKGN